MALSKSFNWNGLALTYHNIQDYHWQSPNYVTVNIGGFLDKDNRISGNGPIMSSQVTLSGDNFSKRGTFSFAELYDSLKQTETFEGATDA